MAGRTAVGEFMRSTKWVVLAAVSILACGGEKQSTTSTEPSQRVVAAVQGGPSDAGTEPAPTPDAGTVSQPPTVEADAGTSKKCVLDDAGRTRFSLACRSWQLDDQDTSYPVLFDVLPAYCSCLEAAATQQLDCPDVENFHFNDDPTTNATICACRKQVGLECLPEPTDRCLRPKWKAGFIQDCMTNIDLSPIPELRPVAFAYCRCAFDTQAAHATCDKVISTPPAVDCACRTASGLSCPDAGTPDAG